MLGKLNVKYEGQNIYYISLDSFPVCPSLQPLKWPGTFSYFVMANPLGVEWFG